MSFVQITGEDYTKLLRHRLTGDAPELTWVQQVRDLLEPHLSKDVSLLDLGCATGYAYKTFRRFGIRYYGLDFEESYLAIARDYFANDKSAQFIGHDITAKAPPVTADIVICSAMLEHASALLPTLKFMADAACKVFVLRTFLGETEKIVKLPSPVREHRDTAFKYNNQYSFEGVLRALHKLDFRTTVHPDRYTQSMPHLVDGLARTFYVLVADRPADAKAVDPREG